jgi:uridine kinase
MRRRESRSVSRVAKKRWVVIIAERNFEEGFMLVIGICGGTGSGKSTIVEMLKKRLGDDAFAYLPHDMYYLNREDSPDALRQAGNFDHMDRLDNKLYVRHVRALMRGKSVRRPVYRFDHHVRTNDTELVEPRPVVVLEGILLFAVTAAIPLIDLKVFVDVPADLRIVRRILRDQGTERGRSATAVIEQYLSSVRPMHERFVEPSRNLADLIVPWEQYNEAALDVLTARIVCEIRSIDLKSA